VHKNEKMKRKRATPLCIFEPERVAASSLMMVTQPSTFETDSPLARFVLRTHSSRVLCSRHYNGDAFNKNE
jgi:hypothetical protein